VTLTAVFEIKVCVFLENDTANCAKFFYSLF